MQTYISFIRGINVSGKNIVKMADFKTDLHQNGFPGAITYIQSGNIALKSPHTAEAISQKISGILKDKHQAIAEVISIPYIDLLSLGNKNPF